MTNPQVRLIPPLDADYGSILVWLKEQHTRGLLPTEVAISTIIVLLEKLVTYNNGTYAWHEPQNNTHSLVEQLEVYKRAVKACRVFVPIRLADHEDGRPRYQGEERKAAYEALDAVDKLEGK